MRMKLTHLILFGISSLTAIATPTKQCIELEIPISIIANNSIYSMPTVDNTFEAVQWTLNVTTWSRNLNSSINLGPKLINSTFSINAQLCIPQHKTPKSNILQIAISGRGFDKRYWDPEINPAKYSYIDAAIKKGYSILSYDMLGSGKSSKPNAYEVVQLPTQVEILAELTKLIKSGYLLTSSKLLSPLTIPTVFKPSKIVHVGHSYGSAVTFNFLIQHGNLSDAAILTGLLFNSKAGSVNVAYFDHEFARQHDPIRFNQYNSGYIVLTFQSDLQKLFFRYPGGFEPEMLTYLEKIKQPEAVGLYASESMLRVGQHANDFKGPVQFMVGEFDFVNCMGDCKGGVYDEGLTMRSFPVAKNVTHYLQPGTGHALSLARNATGGYEVMLGFLGDNGL
ncbi:hypothetical protein QBC38DRAFT_518708 [Podospora fimiseda]|uniref:AB hydrolase-1 domain-containing protein n=1 Tax=Podospora fimiseda TaxID=252190 RepID=A0AAN7BEC7_9PEZI|nr:hypothetical protein QBC38DRAFT_518708 [Podospora fimiseda]